MFPLKNLAHKGMTTNTNEGKQEYQYRKILSNDQNQ